MRLRSGRNTESKLSNRPLPTVYLKPSGSFPRVRNKSQRRWRMPTLHHHSPFHRLWNFSRSILKRYHYKDAQLGPKTVIVSQPLPPILEGTRTILDDLHLPYYDPPVETVGFESDAELSVSVLSSHLGWTISTSKPIEVPSILSDQPASPELSPFVVQPLPRYAHGTGPAMNLPPSEYPDIDVDAEVRHQRRRFELAGLVLPKDWEPLHQEPVYYIRGGTSDSEAEPGDRRYKPELRPSPKPGEQEYSYSDPFYEPPALVQAISVTDSTLVCPRVRSQWESIHTIQIDELEWRLEASSAIAQRDKRRRVGNVDHNQASKNKDSWPQTSMAQYTAYVVPSFHSPVEGSESESGQCEARLQSQNLSYFWIKPEQRLLRIPAEVNSEYRLGDIIANLMTSDLLPISRNLVVDPPRAARCSSQKITLSLACQASPERLPWETEHLPLLFVAQYCSKGGEGYAKAQMAHALHQTLITLVLYYLDTRSSLSQQLPGWMVVYGITYHDDAFTIHAHFPVFHFSAADTDERTPRTFGWAFYSNPVTTFNISSPDRDSRRKEMVALIRLQSQARFVLNVLQGWAGYRRMLKGLYEGKISA